MVKRRTESSEATGITPKGYLYVCWQCAKDAGLEDEYNILLSALVIGDCDTCDKKQEGRMGIEKARYEVLLENERKAASGETTNR